MMSAAPAQAADQYIALALGYVNENPPVTMAGGSSIMPAKTQAAQGALTNCVNNGGEPLRDRGHRHERVRSGRLEQLRRRGRGIRPVDCRSADRGQGMLQNQTGAKVIVTGCSNGATTPPPPNDPPPPPAPKLGPTVSFNTVLGGLEAHITDRSGVSSQCTYATDDYNRSFGLPANSTYDLRIVPAVPRFKNWTVTITCDNGTSTTATTYF